MLAAGAVAGAVYAADSHPGQDRRDLSMLGALKVSLQQAITNAEQQSGGRALSADLLEDRGMPYVAVEVSGPQGVRTVTVDGQSGQVTASLVDGQDDETDDD